METDNLITPEEVKELKHVKNHKRKRLTFGIIAVLIGIVLLINTIHPHFINPRFIFPVVIILIGLKWIFFSKHSHRHCHHRCNC